jgi:hypothetical protein
MLLLILIHLKIHLVNSQKDLILLMCPLLLIKINIEIITNTWIYYNHKDYKIKVFNRTVKWIKEMYQQQ